MITPLAYPKPESGHPNGVQLGGVGTGRLELGTNGRITLAGITHNWQRLLAGLGGTFFFLRAADPANGRSWFRLLQTDDLDGHPGVSLAYTGRHPVAEIRYTLDDCPLEAGLVAFSPITPHDLDASNIPGIVFNFRIRNTGKERLSLNLGLSLEHFLGCGGTGNRGLSLNSNRSGNEIRPWRGKRGGGLCYAGGNTDQIPNAQGQMVVAIDSPSVWGYAFWNTIRDRPRVLAALAQGTIPGQFDAGTLEALEEAAREKQAAPPSWDDPDPRFGGGRTAIEGSVHPAGVSGCSVDLEAGEETTVPLVIAWHMPVLTTSGQPGADHGTRYVARYPDAGSVAEDLLANHGEYLEQTQKLHDFIDTTGLPSWLADKCLNDQTAVTTNSIITRSGDLFTLEASPMMFGALGTLDQRLVSHPGTSLFYPDLNRTELRTFARLQAPDGSLPHFNGNAHTALGSADVEYGVTGWPDLACSFIIQCYRDWMETGEDTFWKEMRPHVQRAIDWLMAADQDGDGIPEGGSSWDIEHYPGCFIATATVWLATLRILQSVARSEGDGKAQGAYRAVYAKASATVEKMWLGSHYMKYLDPETGRGSEDVFVGQLAGEWIVRQLGLPPVLPAENVKTALRTLYRLNGDRERYKLMPIQVCPDGSLPDRRYAWHAWPQYSMVFVDCLALYMGLADEAMASIKAFDHVVREINGTPWATTLWHDARTGKPDFEPYVGIDWYMNTPATWWVLNALSGFAPDEPARTVTIGSASISGESTWPLISSRYWAILKQKPMSNGRIIEFIPVSIFRGSEMILEHIRWRGPETRAVLDGTVLEGHPEDGTVRFSFPSPQILTPERPLRLAFTA